MQTARDRKRVRMQNMVLRLAAVAGGVTVAVMVPKMTRLLKQLDQPAKNRQALYRRLEQALVRLEKAQLISLSGTRGNRGITVTEKGKDLLERIEFGEYEIPEQAFWDGKWRVLLFDISERRRNVREQLRRLLTGAGFVRLQDSAWVYPYPCDEFVSLLRAHLRSGVGEVRSLVADTLESDKALRHHFRL